MARGDVSQSRCFFSKLRGNSRRELLFHLSMTSLIDDVTEKYPKGCSTTAKIWISKIRYSLTKCCLNFKSFLLPFRTIENNLNDSQPSRKPDYDSALAFAFQSKTFASRCNKHLSSDNNESVQQVGIDKFKQRKKFMTESFCRCHDVRCCLQMTSVNLSREEWIRENGNIIKFYTP